MAESRPQSLRLLSGLCPTSPSESDPLQLCKSAVGNAGSLSDITRGRKLKFGPVCACRDGVSSGRPRLFQHLYRWYISIHPRAQLRPNLGDILRGSLLHRKTFHSQGCAKCARGAGHPQWVLNVNYPGGKKFLLLSCPPSPQKVGYCTGSQFLDAASRGSRRIQPREVSVAL